MHIYALNIYKNLIIYLQSTVCLVKVYQRAYKLILVTYKQPTNNKHAICMLYAYLYEHSHNSKTHTNKYTKTVVKPLARQYHHLLNLLTNQTNYPLFYLFHAFHVFHGKQNHMLYTIKGLVDTLLEPKVHWKASLLRNWDTIIGQLHTKVRLLKIEQETVTLGVYDSCWLQELSLLSPLLLRTINEKLDHPHIKQLRFKLTVQKKDLRPEKPKAPTAVLKVDPPSPLEQRALEGVQDVALREALQRFRARCCQERSNEENNTRNTHLLRNSNTPQSKPRKLGLRTQSPEVHTSSHSAGKRKSERG